MSSIMELEGKIDHLKEFDKKTYGIFKRIYKVYFGIGSMKIPLEMENNVYKQFHQPKDSCLNETLEETLKRIENQKIVKTYNKWTGEGALFNHLRTNRPGMKTFIYEEDGKSGKEYLKLLKLINDSKTDCDFCHPENSTPLDDFGRIYGKHCLTAANLAKYDVWSSLVIFKNHDPLEFNLEELSDYIDTAFNWFNKVFQEYPDYKFPFFVWNCFYKAGASQIHGHAQILMTNSIAYAKMESLHNAQIRYHEKTQADYFNDIYTLHDALGLAWQINGVKIYASLTPTKEKEIIIMPPESPQNSKSAKTIIFNILRYFIDVLGVHSYNLSIYCPPLDQKNVKDYNFPYLIKIVDRGNIFRPTADMGGMELFGSTVVADDPYKLMKNIKKYFEDV